MLFFIQKLHNWFNLKLDIVAYLTAENLALRQQLIVLKRNQNRPSLKVSDRVFWKVLSQRIEDIDAPPKSPKSVEEASMNKKLIYIGLDVDDTQYHGAGGHIGPAP